MEAFFEALAAHRVVTLDRLGIAIRVLVPAAATDGALVLFEETTAPGAGPPLHVHMKQMEVFQVVEGRYEFMIGEARIMAGPGDTAVVPPGVAHAFWNIGDAPGRLMFGLSPAFEGEAFFAELAPHVAGEGPPDIAAINAAFAGRFEVTGPPLAVLFGDKEPA